MHENSLVLARLFFCHFFSFMEVNFIESLPNKCLQMQENGATIATDEEES